MPYRDLEAMALGLMQLSQTIRSPDYTTAFRRIQALSIQSQDSIPQAFLDKIRRGRAKLAIDSTGLSITCRGEWLRYKHRDGRIFCKRGFVKLHAGG